ncbi:MAG: helix-turn-helix transcriptional regulator [Firmicutes bacterium]|nr:helix-turn-helix transcriptional regulator [Bacillota bacterium]
MKTLPEKIKLLRLSENLSREQLAQKVGVSKQSIGFYENNQKKPRQDTLFKLAKALNVSVKYLIDDNCENPHEGEEKDSFVNEAHTKFGSKGAREIDELLDENKALFAGGELSQEEKDAFFEAIMTAYVHCKETAKIKFGKKN